MSEAWKSQIDQIDFNSDGKNKKDVQAQDIAKKILEEAQKNMSPKAFEEFLKDAKKIMERQETELTSLERLLKVEKAQTKIEFSLQRHNIRLKGLKDNLKFINDSKIDTGLGEHLMDSFMRMVSDEETPQEAYTRIYNEAKETSYKHIALIQKELKNPEFVNNMTQKQKEIFRDIIIEYKRLGLSSSRSFDIIQSSINSIKGVPDTLTNAAYGVKGTAIGVYEGGKMLIEGVFDLSKFLVKYAGSFLTDNPEYRDEIHKQCSEIWEVVKTVDSTIVLDIMGKEWDKIMALPSEQQAEAIGKFSGNVIAMLGSMGLLGKGSKAINTLSKAQKARGASIMSGEVLGTQTARVGMFILNGPAEELLGGGLAKSFKTLSNKLKGTGALDMKLGEVNKTIGEFEEALEKAKNPKKKETLENALEAMKKEKESLEVQKIEGETTYISPEDVQRLQENKTITQININSTKTLWEKDKTHYTFQTDKGKIYAVIPNSADQKSINITYNKKTNEAVISFTNNGKTETIKTTPQKNIKPEKEVVEHTFDPNTPRNDARLITKEDEINMIASKYKPGREIKIPRTNGSVSEAKVVAIDANTGEVTVKWTENGKDLKKSIAPNKLDEVNDFGKKIEQSSTEAKVGGEKVEKSGKITSEKISQEILKDFQISAKSEVKNFINQIPETQPKYKMKVGEHEFLFSDKIISPTRQEKGADLREYVMGYIKNGDTYEQRMFYFSQSGGNWHSCPGIEPSGRFSKGEYAGLSYEKGTVVPSELGDFFQSQPEIRIKKSLNLLYSDDFGAFSNYSKKAQEFQKLNKTKKLSAGQELDRFESFAHIGQKGYKESITKLDEIYKSIDLQGLDKNLQNTGEIITQEHKYLGKVQVEKYTSKLNGEKVEIQFAHSIKEPNLFWIENISFSNTKLNNYTLPEKSIHAGVLTNKPLEYTEQCPSDINFAKYQKQGTPYTDIRSYTQGNPLIQAYKKVKGKQTIKTETPKLKISISGYKIGETIKITENGELVDAKIIGLDAKTGNAFLEMNKDGKKVKLEISKKQLEEQIQLAEKPTKKVEKSKQRKTVLDALTSAVKVSLPKTIKTAEALKDWIKNQSKIHKKTILKIGLAGGIGTALAANIEGDKVTIMDERGGAISDKEVTIQLTQTSNSQNLDESNQPTKTTENGETTAPENEQNSILTLKNSIKNPEYLESILSDKIENIGKPTKEELIAILENPDLRRAKGLVYNYAIQSTLSMLGYGENMGNIDGIFGGNTKKSVIAFQKDNNSTLNIIDEDFGYFGPKTARGLVDTLKKV